MKRRDFVILSALGTFGLVGAACKRELRCKLCGMRIDPASPWRTDIVEADGEVTSYDAPRCALAVFTRNGGQGKTLRVQDYYDRRTLDAKDVRFLLGGDVLGPMGPDLVPVDPSRASKFIQDHGAERALRIDEITPAILERLK